MQIKATRGSSCTGCGKWIEPGELIEKNDGERFWHHVECPAEDNPGPWGDVHDDSYEWHRDNHGNLFFSMSQLQGNHWKRYAVCQDCGEQIELRRDQRLKAVEDNEPYHATATAVPLPQFGYDPDGWDE